MTDEKSPTERLNDLEERIDKLEDKMNDHLKTHRLITKEIGDIKTILTKLDRLDDIEAAHQETNRLLRKLAGEEDWKPR